MIFFKFFLGFWGIGKRCLAAFFGAEMAFGGFFLMNMSVWRPFFDEKRGGV